MLNRLHQISALLLSLFIGMHILNHYQVVYGIEQHLAMMDSMREIYRSLVFEVLLLAAVMVQTCTGVFFIFRSWGRLTLLAEKAQAAAGCYLAFFMLTHVWDILNTRMQFSLDTNFYLIAAKMSILPDRYFLAAYYVLAIVAITTHLGTALHWATDDVLSLRTRDRIVYLAILIGFVIALPIIAGFSGLFYAIDVPEHYLRSVR